MDFETKIRNMHFVNIGIKNRKIKQATQLVLGELCFFIPKENQKMYYIEDFRGEYSINWIICFDENDKELYRISDKNINDIVWED